MSNLSDTGRPIFRRPQQADVSSELPGDEGKPASEPLERQPSDSVARCDDPDDVVSSVTLPQLQGCRA